MTSLMTSREALEKARKDIEEKFGIIFKKIGAGEAVGELFLLERHINSWGIPYGGVLFNLADVVSGAAYLSSGGNGITVNSHADFMRGSRNAEKLICSARVIKAGKRLSFVEAHIEDDCGAFLCKFSFIFSNLA